MGAYDSDRWYIVILIQTNFVLNKVVIVNATSPERAGKIAMMDYDPDLTEVASIYFCGLNKPEWVE